MPAGWGSTWAAGCASWRCGDPRIAEVRQIGLAIGVEIVRPGTTEPDAATAKQIVEGMRSRSVLIGSTGRHGATLKIRPPLVFQREHADLLVQTLRLVLDSDPPRPARLV